MSSEIQNREFSLFFCRLSKREVVLQINSPIFVDELQGKENNESAASSFFIIISYEIRDRRQKLVPPAFLTSQGVIEYKSNEEVLTWP